MRRQLTRLSMQLGSTLSSHLTFLGASGERALMATYSPTHISPLTLLKAEHEFVAAKPSADSRPSQCSCLIWTMMEKSLISTRYSLRTNLNRLAGGQLFPKRSSA